MKRCMAFVLMLALLSSSTHAASVRHFPSAVVGMADHDCGRVDQGFCTSDQKGNADSFSFAVTADIRNYSGPSPYDTSQYFRGAAEAIAVLAGGDFMISPGDIDPPDQVLWTITRTLGITYTIGHKLRSAGICQVQRLGL